MFVFLADSKKQDMKEFSVEKFFDPVKRPKIDDDLNEEQYGYCSSYGMYLESLFVCD